MTMLRAPVLETSTYLYHSLYYYMDAAVIVSTLVDVHCSYLGVIRPEILATTQFSCYPLYAHCIGPFYQHTAAPSIIRAAQ